MEGSPNTITTYLLLYYFRELALSRIQKRCQSLAVETTKSSDKTVPPLVIFPEGTTSAGRTILPFKRGAFQCMRPVTPVGM